MAAPPNYSQQDRLASTSALSDELTQEVPQISIIPAAGAVQFQKGHLGVEGERAAFEGEVQIKGARSNEWNSVSIALQSTESVNSHSVDLVSRTLSLYQKNGEPPTAETLIPSSILFAIPLTTDTPQCIHGPRVNIIHRLTATLSPSDSSIQAITKTITAHTRRFSARSPQLPLAPESLKFTDPVQMEVQLPRHTFHSAEIIPIYVTIPPVDKSLLERKNLTLRNVMAELHRHIDAPVAGGETSASSSSLANNVMSIRDSHPPSGSRVGEKSQSHASAGRSFTPTENQPEAAVVARSGATCRLHDTRSVKIRLLLRLPSSDEHPGASNSSTTRDFASPSDCGLISQATLLHTVSFKLTVCAHFISGSPPNERTVSLSVPIVILPPQAPASEVDASLDEEYHKKHDRPPIKTSREPHADTFSARDDSGPSGGAAPPPFDEPGGAPPSFTASTEAQSSSHPPTFVESQTDLTDLQNVDNQAMGTSHHITNEAAFDGEGTAFGFFCSEQFDGMQRRDSVLHMDTAPEAAAGPSGHPVLSSQQGASLQPEVNEVVGGQLATVSRSVDDPMDPPPAIDVGYISVPGSREVLSGQQPPPHSDEDPHPVSRQQDTNERPMRSATGPAPPPYPLPEQPAETVAAISRPPPYAEDTSS